MSHAICPKIVRYSLQPFPFPLLNKSKNTEPMPRRRAFVFVNPFSGTKRAAAIFRSTAQPILEAAGWQVTVHGTRCLFVLFVCLFVCVVALFVCCLFVCVVALFVWLARCVLVASVLSFSNKQL